MFFLFILVILFILGVATFTSKIAIQIENLIIDTEAEEKINKESKIYICLMIFGKFKILKNDIKNMNLNKLKLQNKNIDLKIGYKDLLKNIKLQVEKIDLYVQISTQDAALTAILVGAVSAVLGVILRKPKYQVVPIYANKNFLKIKLDGIFKIDLMQYIYRIISNKTKNKKPIFQNKRVEVNYE